MRVISGKYKNKKLYHLKSPHLRASSDFLKETLFNIITHHFKDFLINQHFLDVFAGSGSIALEALSRGASTITLVEKNFLHCKLIKKNLYSIPHNLIKCDFLKTTRNMFNNLYSIVYLDPPYNLNLLFNSLIYLIKLNILSPSSLIVTESKKNTFNPTFEKSNSSIFLNNSSIQLKISKIIGIKELHFFILTSKK